MRDFVRRLRGRLGPVLQSDQEFIETAYLRILGRPVDRAGLAHYRAALRKGLGRTDLLLALAQSEELMGQLARAARAKAGPRAIWPERYREAVDRTNGHVIPVFQAQDSTDFDWLETRILEDGYYEMPGVWNLHVDDDKRIIAEIVASFAPARALELGCAAGAVIECLLDHEVVAEGLDLSWMALSQASGRVRNALNHGDLISFECSEPYDIVFGLDVFEHLNPNRMDAYLSKLSQITRAYVYCNVPAFGADPVFGTVFPYYIDGWDRDTAAGRPFATLEVDRLGYPVHGHLTWADARWWVERFERARFKREPDIERALHSKYDEYMNHATPARRAYFVFSKEGSAAERAAVIERITSRPSRVASVRH